MKTYISLWVGSLIWIFCGLVSKSNLFYWISLGQIITLTLMEIGGLIENE